MRERQLGAGEAPSSASIEAEVLVHGRRQTITGRGNGPLDAFCNGLRQTTGIGFTLRSFSEQSLARGSGAKAAAIVQLEDKRDCSSFGVGIDTDIIIASVKAVLSAMNRLLAEQK